MIQGILRWLQLLAILVWVGGITFFAFVLAPTAFRVLPSVHLAGAVVGASLRGLNGLGLGCGAVFLIVTAVMFRRADMRLKGRYEMQFLLAGVMVLATAYLQFNILPAMDQDRILAGGDVSAVAPNHPARVHFDKLHIRSERVEGAILLLGLGVTFLMSREQAPTAG